MFLHTLFQWSFSVQKYSLLCLHSQSPWMEAFFAATAPYLLHVAPCEEGASLYLPFKYWNTMMRSSLSLLFFMERTNSFGFFLIGWPFDHLCGPPMDFLQSVHIFLQLCRQKLDTLLWVQLDKHWAEKKVASREITWNNVRSFCGLWLIISMIFQ